MSQVPTVNTELEITWPNPKPESFLISSELFEQMINDLRDERAKVNKLSNALIEAQNPGIDIDEVQRYRNGLDGMR